MYSVKAGTCTYKDADNLRIGNQYYAHVHPYGTISANPPTFYPAGTPLGRIFRVGITTSHVHFIDGPAGGPNNNPLFFLDNFVDTGTITVKNIKFYKDDRGIYFGTKTATGEVLVRDNVDILADVYDKMSHGVSDDQGKVMPYKIGYTIRNLKGDIIYDRFYGTPTIRFNKCPLNVNVRYIHKSVSNANPQIWVSNETIDGATPASGSWTTKINTNGTETATQNYEAKFPDGKYIVEVGAADTEGNIGTKTIRVLIDNFPQTVTTTNINGTYTVRFNTSNPVYIKGSGYATDTAYTVSITTNGTWTDGMAIPSPVLSASITTNNKGEIATGTAIPNSQNLNPGNYDLIIDYDNNGTYTQGLDAVCGVGGRGFYVDGTPTVQVPLYRQNNNGSITKFACGEACWISRTDIHTGVEEIVSYAHIDEDGILRFDIGIASFYTYRIGLDSIAYYPDQPASPRMKVYYSFGNPRQPHRLGSLRFTLVDRGDGVFVPEGGSVVIPNFRVNTTLASPYSILPNDTGALGFIEQFVKGSNHLFNTYPSFSDNKNYVNGYYIEGANVTSNGITGYDPSNWRYGIRVNGAKQDEESPDKLFAGQMSQYMDYYAKPYWTKELLLTPNPTKKTNFYQSFLNGACSWFSCDVRGTSTIAIRDINGIEGTYSVDSSAKGFDSELANAKFLWKLNSPYLIWDAMYKPTLSVPHSGYNLQDMINELRARGYDLDWLLDELGLRPILGTVTNTDTPNPTFYFDLNNIFSGTTTIQMDISEDYDFGTLTYSGTPSISFYGTSTGSYTLTEQGLSDNIYFWRIKVVNSDLPNLYSDVDIFEIYIPITQEPTMTITPNSGPVGTLITVSGENFTQDTTITIDFGTHLTITTTMTNSQGSFITHFYVDTQSYGTTIITVTTSILQLTASFFIKESIDPKAIYSEGNVGDEITFSGSGWPNNKGVTIHFGTHLTITTTTTSSNGTFSTTFIASTQSYGTTIITAEGCLATGIYFILPKIIQIKPTSGATGQEVTIQGSGFSGQGQVSIDFGIHQTITFTQASENGTFSVTFIADNQSEGTKTIRATGLIGQQFDTTSFYLTGTLPPPIIDLVFPNQGPVGTVVTITGLGFAGDSIITLSFGTTEIIITTTSRPGGSFSTTFITNTQPVCTKAITATDEHGNYATTIFLLAPEPQITLVSPNSGKVGTLVTIVGQLCQGSITIGFGTNPNIGFAIGDNWGFFSACFYVDTQPPCTKLITASGRCCVGEVYATTLFFLAPNPQITLVSPQSGKVGTLVTIAGQLCPGTITISFGTNPNIAITCGNENGSFSATFIVDTQPPCTKLITASGRCCVGEVYATTLFFLAPNPQITLVSPQSGKVGTLVTIAGQLCQGTITIGFGTDPNIGFAIGDSWGFFSTTFIVNTQPPCTKLITASGRCCVGEVYATTLFFLAPNPQITLVSPQSGKVGTLVTIAGLGFGPNTTVDIAFGTNQAITTTTSSDSGSFSTTFIVDSQPVCTKTITAKSNSCIGEVYATSLFKLIGIPRLILVKEGPSTATSGSLITYTITYSNTGTSRASNLILTDYPPSGFTPIGTTTWSIGILTPGQEGSKTLSGTVTAYGSTTLINEATLIGSTTCPEGVITAFASCSTHIEGMAILILTKNGPQTATFGSVITYTIIYQNTGTSKATNLTLTDTPPSGFTPIGSITWSIGDLNTGSSGSVSLSGTVTAYGSTTLINEATLIGSTTCPKGTIIAYATSSTHIEGNAILTLTKEAPATATSGSLITYTITYSNTGTSRASNLILTDYPPSGFTPIGTTTWSIGILTPGQEGSKTLSGTVTAYGSTTLINEATLIGSTTCPEGVIMVTASCTTYITGRISTIITVLNTTVVQNQIGTLTANLRKAGGNPIPDKVLVFCVDGIKVGSATTNGNGTATISRTCSLSQGTHTITVTFTGDNQYEAGTGTGILYIRPASLPDLIINKMNISPNRSIFEGDRINVVAWIKNIGSVTVQNICVSFLDGTETQGTRTINRLRPGQTEAREMNWKIYPFGTHTIKVYADPDNKIPEIREDNNIGTQTIFVNKRPNKGLLMGTVSDKTTGKVFSNALVTAIGKSFGLDITDNKGRYIIPNLIPGKYLVIAIKLGFIPQTKSIFINSTPTPTILDFELKKVKQEAELFFDQLYSLILTEIRQDKTLSEEGIDLELAAFSAATLFLNSKEELPFLEEPGTATLKLEGGVLKANLRNISVAKIETEAEIEQGDLLPERCANMLRTTEKEGVTAEGTLARLKIEPSEEPTQIKVICTFIDAEGNLIYAQEQTTIEPQAPSVSELLQSYPNPANNACYIPFKLSADSNVTVEAYNILGQRVRTIEAGPRKAGSYTQKNRAIFWDIKNDASQPVASGLYFIRLKAGNFSDTKALVVK